jgi:hypothetical protein
MPVRDMLYDSINYAAQVDAARRSFKELKFDDDGVKITLTAEEFLSGFRKGDKLIPVITAVVLFNPDEWDAPLSIPEEQIAERVAKKFNVSIDYVKNLMMPKAV